MDDPDPAYLGDTTVEDMGKGVESALSQLRRRRLRAHQRRRLEVENVRVCQQSILVVDEALFSRISADEVEDFYQRWCSASGGGGSCNVDLDSGAANSFMITWGRCGEACRKGGCADMPLDRSLANAPGEYMPW